MNTSRGNVLFIILIAVALFAALSYAVSNGMRGGGDTITDEQARVQVSELIQALSSMREGYSYLVNQGCSIDDIAFDYPATTDVNCQIFHPQGAGISYPQNLKRYQMEPDATNDGNFIFVSDINVASLGTSTAERMATLNFVRQNICTAFNKQIGYEFTTVPASDATPTYGDTVTEFTGKNAGCHGSQIWFVLFEL